MLGFIGLTPLKILPVCTVQYYSSSDFVAITLAHRDALAQATKAGRLPLFYHPIDLSRLFY